MTGGVKQAILDWEANAPRSLFFDDVYFSGDGAAETDHVFINGNDLRERFRTADRFAVGEIGFGTGLNILAAWNAWRAAPKPSGAQLEFLSFEKFPLAKADLRRAQAAWPQFAALSEKLLSVIPPPVGGAHRLRLDEGVALTLVLGDARETLARINAEIDAWFLDGFAPAKNPEMWSPEIFAEIARLTKPGATAATFTVAGAVRRALQDAGFSIEKRAGYGRKREMLTARMEKAPERRNGAPWFANTGMKKLAPGARVAIIGGGVAGASLAHELKAAGAQPVIFDAKGIAQAASGNPAGLIMPRLDLSSGPAARFFRTAYVHSLSLIEALNDAGDERFFDPCGVLLKSTKEEDRLRQQKMFTAGLLPGEMIDVRAEGLFFPQAGVINPQAYCKRLARDCALVREDVAAIEHAGGVLEVMTTGGAHRFDAVIIANSRDALRFVAMRSVPLSGVMGQIDYFSAASAPAFATAFGPYAAPAPQGGLVIGATYDPIEFFDSAQTSGRATRENIEAIAAALPEIGAALTPQASQPRAGVRCQTPDRLPVAGPIPDWNFYGGAYDDLRLGAVRDYPPGEAAPGLFVLTGLGSRGLVSAPFAAALMVTEMTGAPFERELAEAIHPARFFIRDLKRSQRIVAK